ncbi:hypothetical protein U0070_025851 [Myodes glareolus]|uniref:Uncharacterized protein n=1 Tax=Myodes glareolus TaxID=447135 RepID=A0AAW0J9I1_MYOGA
MEWEAKCKETMFFCLRGDKRNAILQEGKGILVGEQGERESGFHLLDPRESALKSSGVYASSTEVVRKKITEIKYELRANCNEEGKDDCTMEGKLGGNTITSLQPPPAPA